MLRLLRNVNDSTKKTGIDFVVSVAKGCSLSTESHFDVTILANATSGHFNFAKKVLRAVQSGDEQLLYIRNTKCNMIKATHWPDEISKFVLNESNSGSVPGKEQVSVRYGFLLPKYILLRSRKDVAVSFKGIHLDFPFRVPSIMREF